jgi:hypothetical protein
MTKKRWFILGAIAMVLALAGSSVVLWSFTRIKPGATVENFRRLHRGMTQAEVEEILGQGGEVPVPQSFPTRIAWEGEDGVIYIDFISSAWTGRYQGNNGEEINLRPNAETLKEKLNRWGLLP